MDAAALEAKANVLRHAGTSADDALLRLVGPAAREVFTRNGNSARLLPLLGPDGPIFRGARLLTADRRFEALIAVLAVAPLGPDGLWGIRRELCVLEALVGPILGRDLRALRHLTDSLDALASSGIAPEAASAKHHAQGTAAAALFLQKLRAPDRGLLELLLDGLPFVLGYLRDRQVTRALARAADDPLVRHLPVLHDALWELAAAGSAAPGGSFEQIEGVDRAIESVFARLREEADPAARLAAISALYRLVLCVQIAAVRDRIRSALDALGTAAAQALQPGGPA